MDRSFEVYEGQAMSARTRAALRRRIDWICDQARGVVLDVGCSQGLVPCLLAARGHTVVGVDADTEAVHWAQNKISALDAATRERISLHAVDFADFQTEQRFDTLIAGEYLEHLTDEELALHLQKMALLLKPQGLFVCTTPLGRHPHPDHRQTFLPRFFVHAVGQCFSIAFLDVEDGYLRCLGEIADERAVPDAEALLRLTEKGLLQIQKNFSGQKKARPLAKQAPAPQNELAAWLAAQGFHAPFRYDEALFTALNEYYRDKPIVPRPRQFASTKLFAEADKRVDSLLALLPGLKGANCLEVGCGRGETAIRLSERGQCRVKGVDIRVYPQWGEYWGEHVKFLPLDITYGAPFPQKSFDLIYSLVVFEHILDPLAMLETIYGLLKPGGTLYFTANLYRGPMASHRYREVFFPWPHLLFDDAIFIDYYAHNELPVLGKPAWVNKLTHLHYIEKLNDLKFTLSSCEFITRNIDSQFYTCFKEKLGKYPIKDLILDFMVVHAIKKED